MLGQTLRAKPAFIHGVLRIAANRNRPPIPNADKHPATHRAIPARRSHPFLGDLPRSHVAEFGILSVRVLLAQVVDAKESLDVHAASFAEK
jgi:hypothetical protein